MQIPTKTNLNCSFCSYACTQLTQLESHMRKHTREKPFVCDKCNRVFSTETHLNTHVKNLHHPKPPKVHTETFKCSLCPYETHAKLNYERHVLNHTGERRFHCPQPSCKYAAKTFQEIKQHSIHNHRNERKFKCPFPNCSYRGKSKRMVGFHYVTHNECRPFSCDVKGCKYQAKRKFSMNRHKLDVHHGGHKPFVCSQCEFSTTNKRLLRQHGLTHAKEKPFKCDFSGCSYATKLKNSLNLHIEHRHTDKTFKCDFAQCSFIGSSERFLEIHKKNVHSEKTHKCPCCHYRGVSLSLLRTHMAKHNRSQRMPCQNKSCTIHGNDHEPWKQNKESYEGNPGSPQEDDDDHTVSSRSAPRRDTHIHDPTSRSFHCLMCPKRFHNSALLSQHLRTHTSEKPFKCLLCNYGSARKIALITHVHATHSDVISEFRCNNDEESTCGHCYMNFGTASGLAIHTVKVKTAVVVLDRLQLRFDQ